MVIWLSQVADYTIKNVFLFHYSIKQTRFRFLVEMVNIHVHFWMFEKIRSVHVLGRSDRKWSEGNIQHSEMAVKSNKSKYNKILFRDRGFLLCFLSLYQIRLWWFCYLDSLFLFDKTVKVKFKEKMRDKRKYRRHRRIYVFMFISSVYQGLENRLATDLLLYFGSSSIFLNLR